MAFHDLTRGSIPRLLVMLALPIFGSFVLQSLYSLADLYFVGLLGGEQLAGLGIALNSFFLVLALGQSMGIGALALLSRAYGAKQTDKVPEVFRQSMLLVLVLGGFCWVGGYYSAEAYFSLQTSDPLVMAYGTAYFRIYVATFLFQLFLMVNGYARRALGDFLTPTLLMSTSVLINLAMDPILIFGWGPIPAMGIEGAAWATVGSQVVSASVYLWLIFGSRRNSLLVLRGLPKPHWPTIAKILAIGVPSGGQFVLFSAMNLIMYGYVKPFGADATAAVAVGFRVIHSAILPAVAICAAISSVVGQNYGSRNWPRMRAGVLWGGLYAFGLLGFEYFVIWVNPGFWMGLFSESPGIIAWGSDYLIINGLAMPVFSVGMAVIFGMQGMGKTMMPLFAMVARFGGFVLLLFLLNAAAMLTLHGVFWVNAGAMLLETLIMVGFAAFVAGGLKKELASPVPPPVESTPAAHWQEDVV